MGGERGGIPPRTEHRCANNQQEDNIMRRDSGSVTGTNRTQNRLILPQICGRRGK